MLTKCLIMLLSVTSFIEANPQYQYKYQSQSCPWPHLDHGRVRVRQRTKLVKFMCSPRYELVGNRYATCRNGEWDVPMPVCVRPGCEKFTVENAVQIKAHHDAWVVTFCMPGYKLVGSPALYCNGFKWNATSPSCVNSTAEPSLGCDFENPDICGWTQDELHDFDWKRLNMKTPSSFLKTGPSYDHTLGKGNSGYYMYIESTSRLENDTARLLSPVYDSHLAKDGCFTFFYHMYGQSIGGLKVYQKPDSLPMHEMLNMTESAKQQYILFEHWGDLGDIWFGAAPQLKDFNDSFQIIIEGIRGISFTSDIAIDDVEIRQGVNCTNFRNVATTPSPVYSESCTGRCKVLGDRSEPPSACSCTPSCMLLDNCCADFLDLCIYNSNNTGYSEPDDVSPSDEQPQTEKLVGETTTTVTTTTTPLPTTTPKQPTTLRTTPKIIPTTRKPPTTKMTTSTTMTLPTTSLKTTKPPPTTKKVVTTTKKVVATTQKVTAKTVLPTTKKITVLSTKIPTVIDHKVEEKKSEKEINMQKMVADKPVENKSTSWKTAVITIVILSVFASVLYLAVVSRTARGRVALARLRGRVLASNDSEVRYLNSNDDDL